MDVFVWIAVAIDAPWRKSIPPLNIYKSVCCKENALQHLLQHPLKFPAKKLAPEKPNS